MTSLYKIHNHFDVHCPSAHVVIGGGVRAGDLGDVEPLGVLEEGEELSVGDRIEKK